MSLTKHCNKIYTEQIVFKKLDPRYNVILRNRRRRRRFFIKQALKLFKKKEDYKYPKSAR